jgi:hypothetical protein
MGRIPTHGGARGGDRVTIFRGIRRYGLREE